MGDQTRGRVGFFIHSGTSGRITKNLLGRGFNFLERLRREPYGLVAVFVDPWGGKWDLLHTGSAAAET